MLSVVRPSRLHAGARGQLQLWTVEKFILSLAIFLYNYISLCKSTLLSTFKFRNFSEDMAIGVGRMHESNEGKAQQKLELDPPRRP